MKLHLHLQLQFKFFLSIIISSETMTCLISRNVTKHLSLRIKPVSEWFWKTFSKKQIFCRNFCKNRSSKFNGSRKLFLRLRSSYCKWLAYNLMSDLYFYCPYFRCSWYSFSHMLILLLCLGLKRSMCSVIQVVIK